MEKYVNIMLDKAFKTVFGEKQVAIWISELAHRCGASQWGDRENFWRGQTETDLSVVRSVQSKRRGMQNASGEYGLYIEEYEFIWYVSV